MGKGGEATEQDRVSEFYRESNRESNRESSADMFCIRCDCEGECEQGKVEERQDLGSGRKGEGNVFRFGMGR